MSLFQPQRMITMINKQLWRSGLLLLAVTLCAYGQLALTVAKIDLSQLQGHWEGTGAGGKCSITIEGNSLLYRAGTNWHKTTFTLPPGKVPQQLHATIVDTFPKSKDAIGQIIPALIKIEDGTLTLAAFSLNSEPPKTFDDVDTSNKYFVKKVPQKTKDAKPTKTEL